MRRSLALSLLLIVMPMLAACGPTLVHTDVTRFHDLPPGVSPKSFTILPEQVQLGSLEFQRYAELVAAALEAQGWRPVPSSADADTVVTLRWGVNEPNTIVSQSPSSMFSTGIGYGRRRSFYGAGIGMPLGGNDWDTRVVNSYPKWMEVTIVDAPAQRQGNRRVVFEGRAVAEDSRNEIAPVVPYLVQALFTAFPGANGSTVRVDVPVVPPPG